MIAYTLSRVRRFLREALALAPPPQVTLSRTRYQVRIDRVVHEVRRDGVCSCGGTFQYACPAIDAIRDYLAGGGERPVGHHPDSWPESWHRAPLFCPVCDCPAIPDRYLNSRAGPGWRCSLEPLHFWQVRMEPLRRYRLKHPPEPQYPWIGYSPAQQQAWLEAHAHPPRVVPSQCIERATAPGTNTEAQDPLLVSASLSMLVSQHRPGTGPVLCQS